MKAVHDVKSWPESFVAVAQGEKTFDIRKSDRDYKVGDHLLMREWDPKTEQYTGREIERRITYIFEGPFIPKSKGESQHAILASGYVVLAVVPVPFGQSALQDQRPTHIAA